MSVSSPICCINPIHASSWKLLVGRRETVHHVEKDMSTARRGQSGTLKIALSLTKFGMSLRMHADLVGSIGRDSFEGFFGKREGDCLKRSHKVSSPGSFPPFVRTGKSWSSAEGTHQAFVGSESALGPTTRFHPADCKHWSFVMLFLCLLCQQGNRMALDAVWPVCLFQSLGFTYLVFEPPVARHL